MKHSRVDDSLKYIEQAKDDLRIFEKELMGVNISRNLHMEMGGFLKCADIWMDNFFVDYMMQSKINEASPGGTDDRTGGKPAGTAESHVWLLRKKTAE